MMNELIFLGYILCVIGTTLVCLAYGPAALTALLSVEVIAMNLFVLKQIPLFGLCATASDALSIGATLCLNLLQEYYGRHTARKAIMISFICSVFYLAITSLHLTYTPHETDWSNLHFHRLFCPIPRIIGASLLTYLIAQYTESWLYGQLRKRFSGRFLVLRNYISISLTQLLDTILFSFLALYGILTSLWSIILVSYILKIITIAIATPFVGFSQRIYKKFHV